MTDPKPIDRVPFSNGTEGEAWMANWCARCVHDAPARRGDYGNGCSHILTALTGQTPAEWLDQGVPYRIGDQYHCIDFRPEDDGRGDDGHRPEDPMPGQGELIPRAPYEGTRMFVDVVNEIRTVDA